MRSFINASIYCNLSCCYFHLINTTTIVDLTSLDTVVASSCFCFVCTNLYQQNLDLSSSSLTNYYATLRILKEYAFHLHFCVPYQASRPFITLNHIDLNLSRSMKYGVQR